MIRETLWALPLPHLLTLLSLALAAILACGAGLSAAWFLRRRAVPVQYGLLLSALALTLTAPLLTQTARMTNLGRIEVSVAPVPPQPAAPQPAPVETRPVVQSSPVVVAPPAVAARPAVRAESLSMLCRRYFSWRVLGTALAVVWALGIVVGLARLLIGAILVWRLKRSSEPSVSARVLNSATNAARLLGLRDTPEIRVSSLTVSPMVMGVARPAILLPSDLEERLDDAHLAAALLHETGHIAHRDTLIGLFQRVAATFFWWCPLVHLVNRRMDDLREDICDNYVIRAQGDGLCLAQVLVHVAERTQDWARMRWIGAMAMTEPTGKGFEGRVRRLLQKERSTVTRMNLAAVCATMAFAALLGGAILVTTVRAADKSEDAASAKTPELCVRTAKQQGQFDLELRLPGKGSNPRMIVEAGKWGMLEVALDAATQLTFRARVNPDKQQVRVSGQVTVAVTGGFQQWILDDEPWPVGEWKALKEIATSQPAVGEFNGVKEVRFSRDMPDNPKAARAALQLLYDAEAQQMRATRPIALPSDCSAATNGDVTLTKTIDTITLQGDRTAVTVTDRTSINAKRNTSGKVIVIENVVVTKEEWERDAEGKWGRTRITGQSSQHFEDGKLVEAPKLQSSHDGPAAEKPDTRESLLADWGEAVNGLQTRLSAEKDRVKTGEPLRLKLELRNVGTENRSYDAQQVAVNDPLIVRGPKGEEIPFVAGRVSTLGGGHSIKPGETVVLFDGLDATGQYVLTALGVHTFQFRGRKAIAFLGEGEMSIPPSNTVRVELVGEPPAAAPATRASPAAGAVRVRILSGSDRDPARDAVEEWIAKGLADAGSPVTSALTDWITLSDNERELYSSMQGGRIIKGRVSDKGEVEITGMKIGQSPRIIAVRSGQKQVVKLTNYPGAGNVFIAVEPVAGAPREEIALPATRAASSLELSVTSNRTVTEMTADGHNAKPVQLKIAFTNRGDSPIKLDTYMLLHRLLRLRIDGPAGGVVTSLHEIWMTLLAPTEGDFPVLAPGEAFVYPDQPQIPSGHSFGTLRAEDKYRELYYAFAKPGIYRIAAVYEAPSPVVYPGTEETLRKVGAGTWEGRIESAPLELRVINLPPATQPTGGTNAPAVGAGAPGAATLPVRAAPLAAGRAAKLLGDLKTFTLQLNYSGQEEKPYYRLLMSVPPLPGKDRDNPFFRQARVTEQQARAIIEHLLKNGYFEAAMDGNRNASPARPKESYYSLALRVENDGKPVQFEEWLSLDTALLYQRLDGLRAVLEGDAAKDMDLLIGRVSGHRRALKEPGDGPGAETKPAGSRESTPGE